MQIHKIINNNIVYAINEHGVEIIVMGRGLGFQKKPGQIINEAQIEKVYVLEEADQLERFKTLIESIPLEHITVSSEIIDYAKSVITRRINESIYITLTDHINFSVERAKQGMLFSNPLLIEVKTFYPSEYLIGEYATALIENKLGVKATEDEAATIALHLVNAEFNTDMSDTMHITSLIREVLEIVRGDMNSDIDEKSLHYCRFVTHMKFMVQRLFAGQLLNNNEEEFANMITSLYPKEYNCANKIAEFIKEKYEYVLPKEELAYLTVHIKRIQPDTKDE
ncbi:MAG: PRD domain-containing protein [Lachnospiraceae bacterium]|nr:PRD domain-containing protein [Lachnospiraceae bacterium]